MPNCARKSYKSLYRRSGRASKTSITDAGARAAAAAASRSPLVIDPEPKTALAIRMTALLLPCSGRIRLVVVAVGVISSAGLAWIAIREWRRPPGT
jgi:hypothetical protein